MEFHLVTPEKEIVSLKSAAHVAAPGVEGDFGVLPGHMRFMTLLKQGTVTVHEREGGAPRRFSVTGGFADVTPVRVTILAEEADELSS